MQRNKKGVSPLVATVILIVFAIALSAIILSWLTTFTGTTTESTEESAEKLTECAKASVTIDDVYANSTKNTVKIDIRNTGLVPVNVTNVAISNSTFSCKLIGADTKLQVGEGRSYTDTAQTCQITCNTFKTARVTTECGSATATHTRNATIVGCGTV